jgi:hypothetical protein
MTTSTTTYISLVNKVLENIGERPVISFNSAVARKCLSVVNDALTDLSYAYDWSFLKASVIANSWKNEVADVGNIQRLNSVSYGSLSEGYRELTNVSDQVFDNSLIVSGVGNVFNLASYGAVRVNPYPKDNNEQVKYRFYVIKQLELPINQNDIVQVPDRFISLVNYNACKLMCVAHLDDSNGAQTWNAIYSDQLRRIITRETSTTASSMNVYKRRGSY